MEKMPIYNYVRSIVYQNKEEFNMAKNEDFRFVSSVDSIAENELKDGVSVELGNFFDNVMSTVVDYFEEAIVE